ncbi:benzoylformate decarboxylase [Kibdelosporangium aridum]|uniref:benzoylformate decarboxylase n=1 Tax=Kibdelosporangium aridum TaxID=2030 RepID=UPI001F43AAE4|nr:benzoylformate decarboxylase [Kibdelosporangium aridum]
MNLTVVDAVRELMRAWQLTKVFGNPGSTEVPFLADWPEDFDYVLGLQESVVVAMADGYAQASGLPVVVNLHSAGGTGHAMGSIVTAYHNRTPMIVLAGQQARSLLPIDPFLSALEPTHLPQPYVKWSVQPARAQDVPAAFARAYHVATQPPCGPVLVSVPSDDWNQPAVSISPRPRIGGDFADTVALDAVATKIAASTQPVVVVGAAIDADHAVSDMVLLAERIQAPVWAAPFSARCSFPEDHSLFAGFLPAARQPLAETLAGHDLVVVIGAPAFTEHVVTEKDGPDLPPLILIHDDEQVLARAPHAIAVRATPGAGIRHLLCGVTESASPRPPIRQHTAAPEPPAAGERMSGAYVLHTIRQTMPTNTLIVEEAPSHRPAMHQHLPITLRQTGFLTGASGVLGYGLPAAIGAAMAAPDRSVVAIIGDGSTMYSVQALWTAARYSAPLTVVVMDNGEYAAVANHSNRLGVSGVPGIQLGEVDFRALANGQGCQGVLVSDPVELARALTDAVCADEPTVLHVLVQQARATLPR